MSLPGSDVKQMRVTEFQNKMSLYLQNRRNGQRTTTSLLTSLLDQLFATYPDTAKAKDGTLTVLGRYTLQNKEDVVRKINEEFKGVAVTYNETDIEAARNSDLGKILEQYEDVLPPRFKLKEKHLLDEQSNRMSQREARMRK